LQFSVQPVYFLLQQKTEVQAANICWVLL